MDNIKIKESHIFETNNIDLATFLVYSDIKILEYRIIDQSKKIVCIRFLDEKRNCLDLERIFLSSEFKKFRDINKYLLKKIHETLRNEI